MKMFNQYLFLFYFYILYLFDISFCIDNVYEQISPYMQDSQIIDPNSLFYNRQSQTIQIPKNYKYEDVVNNKIIVRNVFDHQLYCKDNYYEVFITRLINMLILKSNFQIINDIAFGKLDLEATIEELEVLKSFRERNISIRQIDTIISNIVRPVPISSFDKIISYTDILMIYFYENRIFLGTIILILFIIRICLKIKWTRPKIIILTFDVMISISYIITYWDLVQDKQIKLAAQEKMYSSLYKMCHRNEINFFSKVFFFFSYRGFSNDDCLQYFETIITNPALKVTPLHVLTHMCSTCVFYPFSIAGHYLSDFIENYTGSLFFPLRILIKVFLLLFIPIGVGVLIFFLFPGSMGSFVHFYLSGRPSFLQSTKISKNDRQAIEIIQLNIDKDISGKKHVLDIRKNLNGSTHIQIQVSDTAVNNINSEFSGEECEKILKKSTENKMNKVNIIKRSNSLQQKKKIMRNKNKI